jgi:hypothetical protein
MRMRTLYLTVLVHCLPSFLIGLVTAHGGKPYCPLRVLHSETQRSYLNKASRPQKALQIYKASRIRKLTRYRTLAAFYNATKPSQPP